MDTTKLPMLIMTHFKFENSHATKNTYSKRILAILAALLLAMGHSLSIKADGQKMKAVVFDFEMADTSGEGELPEHPARIQLVTQLLKDLLVERGNFEIISIEPAKELIQKRSPLRRCNGCETKIASQLGGDYAFLGRIHKVSTLIMAVAISVTDTHRNVPIRAVRVGIRGDTDESWTRGVRYIVKNKLNLKEF